MKKNSLQLTTKGLLLIGVIVTVLSGSVFYMLQAEVKAFRNDEIAKHMSWMGNSVTYFCSTAHDQLARVGSGDDRVELLLKQTETLQLIEDFARNNEFKIIVFDTSIQEPYLLLSTIIETGIDETRVLNVPMHVLTAFSNEDHHYSLLLIPFESWSWKIALLKDEGSYEKLQSRLTLLYASFGTLIVVAGLFILLFLNQRARAEHALKRSELDLKSTLDSLHEGIITVDEHGSISRVNPAALSIMECESQDDLLGFQVEKLFEILPLEVDDKNDFMQLVANGKKNENQLVAGDFQLKQMTGKRKIVSVRMVQKHGYGSGNESIISFIDITERKHIEAQLQQVRKMESIGQLAGGIAHDFNNMLAGILGMSELLAIKLKDNEPLMKYVRVITESTQRASELTGKLLAFSRKGKLITKVIDIHTIVVDVITILERSIDRKIKLTIESEPGKAFVSGDPGQLQNALLNLAINARDSMPKGGNLTIKVTSLNLTAESTLALNSGLKSGPFIRIDVEDTGHGIPAEVIPKIFEPFFTTKDTGKGTGLGLAAVYGTVEEHLGTVTVESIEDVYTTFSIYLPATTGEEPKKQENGIVDQKPGMKRKILLVDDEESVRDMAGAMLEELDFEVVLAGNGLEAIKNLQKNTAEINYVILDSVMPEMNGAECFYELKKIKRDIKILLCSGFTKGDDVNELTKAGLSGFLKKPYTFDGFRNAVETLTG